MRVSRKDFEKIVENGTLFVSVGSNNPIVSVVQKGICLHFLDQIRREMCKQLRVLLKVI